MQIYLVLYIESESEALKMDQQLSIDYDEKLSYHRETLQHAFLYLFIAGRYSAYFWTSALRPCNGPVR